MRIPRLYCPFPTPPQAGALLTLPERPARHWVQVLRAKPGQPVRLFAAQGLEWQAELARVTKHEVQVRLLHAVASLPVPRLTLTLAQGIARGERMDFIVQKAVELGVSHIVPLLTEQSTVRYPDALRAQSRHQHWQEVILSACEQSGRADIPGLSLPQPLATWLGSVPPGLYLQPNAEHTLAQLAPSLAPCLLVGPEGGLSPAELDAAQRHGWIGLRLGPRVLRTETAGLAALAAIQTLWGDFA